MRTEVRWVLALGEVGEKGVSPRSPGSVPAWLFSWQPQLELAWSQISTVAFTWVAFLRHGVLVSHDFHGVGQDL